MPGSETRYDILIAKLREREYRLTPQRVSLIRLIAASEGHPSAAQLFERIKTDYPTMSQATVYKTLNLLKEMGELLEIPLRDDNRYDGSKPYPHPHLICIDCQKIIDGEIDLIANIIREMEQRSGYQITRHQLDFFGTCPDCQKKNTQNKVNHKTS